MRFARRTALGPLLPRSAPWVREEVSANPVAESTVFAGRFPHFSGQHVAFSGRISIETSGKCSRHRRHTYSRARCDFHHFQTVQLFPTVFNGFSDGFCNGSVGFPVIFRMFKRRSTVFSFFNGFLKEMRCFCCRQQGFIRWHGSNTALPMPPEAEHLPQEEIEGWGK